MPGEKCRKHLPEAGKSDMLEKRFAKHEVIFLYIFDLDGTITDTNGVWQAVDVEFLTRRGLEPTLEYTEAVTRSIYPIAARFTRDYYRLPDTPEEIMAEWDALAERHYRELAPLKPGAEAFLRQCAAQGKPMTLFTACRPALCLTVLNRFGLTGLFGHIVYAEEIGLEKHDPQCFLRLSEMIAAPPPACVLFDDSPDNCATAARAGMDAVGVYDPLYEARQEELRTVCTRYVRSLEELLY